MIYYMIKLKAKTTAYSHTCNKPISVNNGEKSQAIVFVDLSNAWLYYEKLGFNMVPFTLQLENGKKSSHEYAAVEEPIVNFRSN